MALDEALTDLSQTKPSRTARALLFFDDVAATKMWPPAVDVLDDEAKKNVRVQLVHVRPFDITKSYCGHVCRRRLTVLRTCGVYCEVVRQAQSVPADVRCCPSESLLRTGIKRRRSLCQLLEQPAQRNAWSERPSVSVTLVVRAIHELGHLRVRILHVLMAGVHGRPRDADLVAGVVSLPNIYLEPKWLRR